MEIRKDLRRGFSRNFGNKFGLFVLDHAYKYSIDQESENHLIKTGKFCEENREYNVLIAHTHRSEDDAPAGTYINRKYLDPRSERKWVVPVAYYFMSQYGFRHKFKKSLASSIAILAASNFMDLDYYGVIQPYQVESSEFPYTPDDARESYERFNHGLRETMEKGSMTISIAPEGHRSDDGQMQKGESGVENIANRLRPCIILPVGFYCPDGSRDINLRHEIQIRAQEPFILSRGERIKFFDIMSRLSLTLPESARGVWRYAPMRVNIEDWSKQKSQEEIQRLCEWRGSTYFEITPESFRDNVSLRRVFPFGLTLKEPIRLLKISPEDKENPKLFIQWFEANNLNPHFGHIGRDGMIDLKNVHIDLYGDKLRKFSEIDKLPVSLWREQIVNFI